MFKKILVISLLVGSIVLAGCSQQKQLSQDELFKKKQECIKYKESLQKDIDKMSGSYIETINEIFYSPTQNSCFALTYRTLPTQDTYIIRNLLTNEYEPYSELMYRKKIKELKGE